MTRPIPIIEMPTAADFIEQFVARNQPVVVTGLDYDHQTWSPAGFGERLGDLTALVYGTLFDLDDIQPVADYLDDWFDQTPAPGDDVPYIRWYNQLRDVDFAWGDDAFDRLHGAWTAPPCLPADGYVVPPRAANDPTRDHFPYRGILVAARGARTRLHRDPFGTDAVVCQFHGTKHAALYHPDRADELTAVADSTSFGGFVDVRADGRKVMREPDFEGTVGPGTMIYIPRGWLHDVAAITDTLSVTWNFIHHRGSDRYRAYLADDPRSDSEYEILRYCHQRAGIGHTDVADLTARLDALATR